MIERKHILMAGGTGFLGQVLKRYFEGMGFQIKNLTRNPTCDTDVFWNAKELGDWTSEIEWADIVINLTGKSVDCRYTPKNRKEIIDSRVQSTSVLAQAIEVAEQPPALWINAASATIYVHSETQQMTEDEGIIGDDFSMNVCKKWEAAFFSTNLDHTRRVALRTSIVLGRNGGAYPKLKQLTNLFFGGKQGNGDQFISWIHELDFCRAVDFIIHHANIVGAINIVAPQPIRNKDFMAILRKTLGKKCGIGQSKWVLELGARMIGTETELLLKSRNVIPERLLEKGFGFQFNNIEACLANLAE